MKWYCEKCKKIVMRDMRKKTNKLYLKKGGYKSYCGVANKTVILIKKEAKI